MFALVLTLSLVAGLDDDIAFQEGKRFVESFEYEKAVFKFREAARDDRPAAERATVLVWLGLTYAKLGEQVASDEAFDKAVALDANVVLPASAPPKVVERLEEAKKRAKAGPKDPVVIEPPPPEAPKPAGAPWALYGGGGAAAAGVVAVGVGVFLGVGAQTAHDAAVAEAFQSDKARLAADADAQALGANIAYGVGGALVAVGAGLMIFNLMGDS